MTNGPRVHMCFTGIHYLDSEQTSQSKQKIPVLLYVVWNIVTISYISEESAKQNKNIDSKETKVPGDRVEVLTWKL